ncbi:hypothetical protein ACX3O0_01365 [Homoserinimonas sp. A447]
MQTKTVGFNVDTPVYEGDQLSWSDPRGGEAVVWAHEVNVADAPGMPSEMAHITVKFSKTAPHRSRAPPGSGHTIIIHGSHMNVALEGSSITQQVPVTEAYQGLADAVGRALAIIEQTDGVDEDEAVVARESAVGVLEESAKPHPDPTVIKRLLPTLRGVLTSAASAGADSAATALVSQLFV